MSGIPQVDGFDGDPVKMFRSEPELLAYARDEVRRLKDRAGPRGSLADNDYESKIRCRALERMLETYERSRHE